MDFVEKMLIDDGNSSGFGGMGEGHTEVVMVSSVLSSFVSVSSVEAGAWWYCSGFEGFGEKGLNVTTTEEVLATGYALFNGFGLVVFGWEMSY